MRPGEHSAWQQISVLGLVLPRPAWLPGVRRVAEVGMGEAVVVLHARAEEPVQAVLGEPASAMNSDGLCPRGRDSGPAMGR